MRICPVPLTLLVLTFIAASPAAAQAQGGCGPHLATYVRVESTVGDAVMCVRFVDRASFAFYMEGIEDGQLFRRLGYASRASVGLTRDRELNFTVQWANIIGNGEQLRGQGRSVESFGTIGYYDWDEDRPPKHLVWIEMRPAIWRLWSAGEWLPPLPPLNRIKACGPGLRQYDVTDAGGKQVLGVRCAIAANDQPIAAWVGAGAWGNAEYLHLGTAFFGVTGRRYGASDICRPGFVCSKTAFGDVQFDPERLPDIEVRGAWNERWRPVGRGR